MDHYLEIGNMFSNRGDFFRYRRILANVDLPCVPYIGMWIKDLRYLHQTASGFLHLPDHPDNIINYEKYTCLFEIIQNIQHFCSERYNFNKSEAFNFFANGLDYFDREELDILYESKLHTETKEIKPKKNFFGGFVRARSRTVGNSSKPKASVEKKEETTKTILTPENMTFENIPDQVISKARKGGIVMDDIKDNLELFYTVAYFQMSEAFKNFTKPKDPDVDTLDWVHPDAVASARETIVDEDMKVIKKRYKKQGVTGEGGFGCVIVAKNQEKKKVAIKILKHDSDFERKFNWYEVAFMTMVRHECLVGYYETYTIKDELWIVMEFLEGGTLREATRFHKFSDQHCAYVTREMLKGISFIHQNNFVHRDLKSANVMLDIKGYVKLIDFGLVADVSEGPRKKLLGSPFWIPPEMILGEPHSYPADIWSMAVLVYELITQQPPLYKYGGLRCMFTVATKGLRDEMPDNLSDMCHDFLSSCFTMNQHERPTAAELSNHPWVARRGLSSGIEEILHGIFFAETVNDWGLL
eukprot:TRINITY_DN3676_c0_g2_i1.p1 TRINITY_DN3676_c0_g2~~TRINITY_DN3676_c0_g2_i1.p1  ORF type:complete len:564 (+),score=110.64 TRINITY_DN3676_c0_g2_i1:112-1692(+)